MDHTAQTGSMQGRRLVVRHCPRRARKNAFDRGRALERARKRLTSTVEGSGRAGRFIKVERGTLSINDEAIRRDARFDGLHGLWSSLDEPPRQIRDRHAELWRIEHGFRVLKSTLAVRPVFHWTERRVRAHLASCFVAFALLRIFRWRYHRQHPQMPLSVGAPTPRTARMSVSIFFREFKDRWREHQALERLREEVAARAGRLPPLRLDQVAEGVRQDRESLRIFHRMYDGRVNIPDVFRVGCSFGRKGGVKPVR